jgi:hypothetical protein
MGDKIIITDEEESKPQPQVVVIAPDAKPKVEKIVTEKTRIIEPNTIIQFSEATLVLAEKRRLPWSRKDGPRTPRAIIRTVG